VSGYPGNAARGLPYINGLIILNDPDTGVPTAVLDGTWITAKRTAAASAVSARYLARSDSEVLGVLGCGVQGRNHVEALTIVLPGIKRAFAYDLDPSQARTFAEEVQQRNGIEVRVVSEPRDAVSGADVLVTAGPILRVPHGTIKAGWMAPGTFASAVDFDSYFDGAALRECAKFTTDDLAQLLHFRDLGYFQDIPEIYAELADLVAGKMAGRQSADERTMAVNLGVALDDIAVAPLVFKRAQEVGAGRWLPL
jgi:ornithine cyclodeaminase/alanine dehydrogenase